MKQSAGQSRRDARRGQFPDIWMVVALAMLVVWAIAVVKLDAPGWMHALLTVGVFLVILRIVVRGTPARREK